MNDVIGRVLECADGVALIEKRDGSLVLIDLPDIVTAKVVSLVPKRSRRASSVTVDDLTRICSRGWPAPISQPLGEWEMRAASGFTGRANSAAIHGQPGCSAGDAIAAMESFYAAHDLPVRAQTVVGSFWESVLVERGWAPLPEMLPSAVVQVAQLDPESPASTNTQGVRTTLSPHVTGAWLSRYRRAEDPLDSGVIRAVLEGPRQVAFASIDDLAIGRIVVTGEWAGISCVEVAPDKRRQGLARDVVDACLRWAAGRGADKAYLQVERENAAAAALYASYGFIEHHEYRYLSPPAERG